MSNVTMLMWPVFSINQYKKHLDNMGLALPTHKNEPIRNPYSLSGLDTI